MQLHEWIHHHAGRTPEPRATSTSESTSHHSPPWNAYWVSQYTQRSGQPVSRMKRVGQPTASASPWAAYVLSHARLPAAVYLATSGLSEPCSALSPHGDGC